MKKGGKIIYVEDLRIGGFTVWYKDDPAIIAEGDTKEEARKNLEQAARIVNKYRKNNL
jgi:predicted RNase H-like HicB family nuclease